MKIDEGVNGKIHAKLRQMLNSKAIWDNWNYVIKIVKNKGDSISFESLNHPRPPKTIGQR